MQQPGPVYIYIRNDSFDSTIALFVEIKFRIQSNQIKPNDRPTFDDFASRNGRVPLCAITCLWEIFLAIIKQTTSNLARIIITVCLWFPMGLHLRRLLPISKRKARSIIKMYFGFVHILYIQIHYKHAYSSVM